MPNTGWGRDIFMGTVRPKIVTVFGTRPEAVKMAPVIDALARSAFDYRVVVTGQHREMLDQVLKLFAIKPHYDLNIMQHGQTLTDVTTRVLTGLEPILQQEQPHAVLVHGDTTTALGAALAAFYQQIPVGHVEAGLRTADSYDPFPEEMNRRLVDRLADYHFAPTQTAADNLSAEGANPAYVFVTGNTVIDALLKVVKSDYRFRDPHLAQLTQSRCRLLLVTTHRRENIGERMAGIYRALRRIIAEHPDVELVFSLHKNPAIREQVRRALGNTARIHLIESPEYVEFANLMNHAYFILTDSGGIQEEAPALGKPVLVLRETTERPEGISAGTLWRVGTAEEEIVAATEALLGDTALYQRMAQAPNPYGDGKAAQRIITHLTELLL
jgi:UDP-N-acetylglucosamine 2-epimerase (non-hydrolysing)